MLLEIATLNRLEGQVDLITRSPMGMTEVTTADGSSEIYNSYQVLTLQGGSGD